MAKQINLTYRKIDRTHLIVFMFSILIGQALYMLFDDFGIGEWFFPIWLFILILTEAIIILKDKLNE